MSGPHIAVLGAGIVGVCTALALRQAGLAVTLLDPGEPGGQLWQRCLVQPGLGGTNIDAGAVAARTGYVEGPPRTLDHPSRLAAPAAPW